MALSPEPNGARRTRQIQGRASVSCHPDTIHMPIETGCHQMKEGAEAPDIKPGELQFQETMAMVYQIG